MSRKKTINSLIQPPGTIRGVLKRKKIQALEDPDGQPIPLDYIDGHLLTKDRFVRQIAELWLGIFRQMAHLKKLLLDGGPEMYEYLQDHDDIRADSKGGFTEYDFGRNIKVIVSYNLRYDFDDQLMQRSAAEMDAFLEAQGTPEIAKIVQRAFKKQTGQYDVKALNRLNELNISDEHFKKAMQLKNKAMTSTPTKLRTQLKIRDDEGEFIGIPLSLSEVTKEDGTALNGEKLRKMIEYSS
jgi:hypothetical protein